MSARSESHGDARSQSGASCRIYSTARRSPSRNRRNQPRRHSHRTLYAQQLAIQRPRLATNYCVCVSARGSDIARFFFFSHTAASQAQTSDYLANDLYRKAFGHRAKQRRPTCYGQAGDQSSEREKMRRSSRNGLLCLALLCCACTYFLLFNPHVLALLRFALCVLQTLFLFSFGSRRADCSRTMVRFGTGVV